MHHYTTCIYIKDFLLFFNQIILKSISINEMRDSTETVLSVCVCVRVWFLFLFAVIFFCYFSMILFLVPKSIHNNNSIRYYNNRSHSAYYILYDVKAKHWHGAALWVHSDKEREEWRKKCVCVYVCMKNKIDDIYQTIPVHLNHKTN